jgi:hypothetical protein
MIEDWVSQRPVRIVLTIGVLVVGFVGAVLLMRQSRFAVAMAIFSICLATLVGTGKLATPWGFNAATTAALSSGRGYRWKILLYIAAYVLPAALVWGVVGLMFWVPGNIPLLIAVSALAYALWYGTREALALPRRVPGLAWQVPSGWINRRPAIVQTLTWGMTLGPGLVTRNPYAGMWLLPLLLALNHGLLTTVGVGVVMGAAHGGARALGVLSNRRQMDSDMEYAHLKILGAQLRWAYIDGLALMLAAGALAAYIISLLGAHV